MKVLQVITKGETGGAQSHVRTLCAALSAQGVAVQAAIGGTGPLSPLGRDLEALGLRVHGIPVLDNGLRPVRLLRATRDLLRIVRTESPDLLHAHSAMAGVAARIAGALSGVPVIYTVHGFAFKAGNAWPRRAVAWTTEALLAPLTRRMVCVSEHERALARSLPLPGGRLVTVVNGVDDIAAPADAPAWKREGSSIAMVARMAPPKRHDLLLHALARLRDTTGQTGSASLLGDGPDRPAHEALAARLGLQTSVDFQGDVDDVPAQLARHGIFVLMSDHEGLPISLIEAMRAGMAIVASDLPGVRELLPDPGHALLVPADAEALAAALRQLMESPALRARLGAAARRRYEQHYTAERMGSAVRGVYAAALRHSRS